MNKANGLDEGDKQKRCIIVIILIKDEGQT
jgi:hypothetical protein